MKIFCKDRRAGKTRLLIEMAHNRNIYIVCLNKSRARSVFKMSQKLGKSILYPLSLDEYINGKIIGSSRIEYLLDDADDMVYSLIERFLLKGNVKAITMSSEVVSSLFSELTGKDM